VLLSKMVLINPLDVSRGLFCFHAVNNPGYVSNQLLSQDVDFGEIGLF